MNTSDYIRLSERSESMDFIAIANRLHSDRTIRILHMAMGMVTESAEVMDALKKYLFYGKPLDIVNLLEEMGDQFWYLAGLARALDHNDFDEILETNYLKLKARFPDKFTDQKAIERDLGKEREILESMAGIDDQPIYCEECKDERRIRKLLVPGESVRWIPCPSCVPAK